MGNGIDSTRSNHVLPAMEKKNKKGKWEEGNGNEETGKKSRPEVGAWILTRMLISGTEKWKRGKETCKKTVRSTSLHLRWGSVWGEALCWRQQQLPWIFHSGLHGVMAARRHRPCSFETSLLLAVPTRCGETELGGNKSQNCFEKGAKRKLIQRKLSVFMDLWKLKAFSLCCYDDLE